MRVKEPFEASLKLSAATPFHKDERPIAVRSCAGLLTPEDVPKNTR
jgi:hypothetical protein